MKLKRKGGLTAGIITLSAVALTSVGFAAWVISAGDTATVTGNIEVDEVTDHSHPIYGIYDPVVLTGSNVEKLGANSSQSIRFGAPVNETISGSRWLSYDQGSSDISVYESLTATYYVCVGRGSNTQDQLAGLIKVGFEVVESNDPGHVEITSTPAFDDTYSGFTGAKNLGMVTLPSVKFSLVASPNTIEEKTSADETKLGARDWFKVDIAFNWGSLFNWTPDNFSDTATYELGDVVTYEEKNYVCKTAVTSAGTWSASNWEEVYDVKNPFYYYNSMLSTNTISDTHPSASLSAAAHANKYLGALKTLFAGVKYNMTFKTYADETEKASDTAFATDNAHLVVASSITA